MGIEAIGSGLKTVLTSNVPSLAHIYAPNELPDSVSEFPAALIVPGPIDYGVDFQGDHDVVLRCIILLQRTDTPSAINAVLDFMEATGTTSVVAAVNADRTLNSSCDTSWVTRCLGVGQTQWGINLYLSTEFEVVAKT